jgi:hypothetical protein
MDTIRERDSNLFDRLAYTDTYATSTMKPKLYKQEETQVNDQSSRSSTSISRKSHTSASFFDRLAHTETYATQQTRKQNRGKNDGTFAETSKSALMRDFKGGTYFHGKMDPATERRKSSEKPGELRKSLNKPLRNQEFYDRMTYHETYASAQTRKMAREESDSSTFAEANKGALMRDYKGSTMLRPGMDPTQERRKVLAEEEKKRKAIHAKKLKNQSFYERMVHHETYASAQLRKQNKDTDSASTLAESVKKASLRDFEGPTQMDPRNVVRKKKTSERKVSLEPAKNQDFFERMAKHDTYASSTMKPKLQEKRKPLGRRNANLM